MVAVPANPQATITAKAHKKGADPFAERVKARINECMALAGQPPQYTSDGRRMKERERVAWRLEQIRRKGTELLLSDPRYRHIFQDKIEERLRYLRSRS